MLYSVELPRSKYYTDGSVWDTDPSVVLGAGTDTGPKIIVGNDLYAFKATGVTIIHLATGESEYIESIDGATGWNVGSYASVCTDGQDIYLLSTNMSTSYATNKDLWKFDCTSRAAQIVATRECSDYSANRPAMAYNPNDNCIYILGGINGQGNGMPNSPSHLNNFAEKYDIDTATLSTLTVTPMFGGAYATYVDVENNRLYFGLGVKIEKITSGGTTSSRVYVNNFIYYLDMTTGLYTLAKNDMAGIVFGSYVQMGDHVLVYGGGSAITTDGKTITEAPTRAVAVDMTTGTTTDVSPDPCPMGISSQYSHMVARKGNTIYAIDTNGLYSCTFFTDPPTDAPIVCKIFKGQKYHTLEPFSIPNKANFLTTQQTATADIEIKMYDYASHGGQLVYIET